MGKGNFDYENAERDIWDNGGDPDYLSHYNEARRDDYLKKMGMDPDKYKTGSSKKNHSKHDSEGCYLTSACVKAKNLPDNCEELTILRSFRDTYLRNSENGMEDINEYYSIAPGIVKAINCRSDADSIWKEIYENMILPACRLIKAQKNEEAYELYKVYTLKLKNAFE